MDNILDHLEIDKNREIYQGITGIYVRARFPDSKTWHSTDIATLKWDSLKLLMDVWGAEHTLKRVLSYS